MAYNQGLRFFALVKFNLPGSTNPNVSLLLPGTVFALLTFLVKGPIGYGSGILSTWLRSRPRALTWINRTSGGVLVGLGVITGIL